MISIIIYAIYAIAAIFILLGLYLMSYALRTNVTEINLPWRLDNASSAINSAGIILIIAGVIVSLVTYFL